MRRWVFAALVLANLGVLMWGTYYLEFERPESPEPQAPIAPEKMKLLREASGSKTARAKPENNAESAPKPPPPPAVEQPIVSASVCYRLGTFHEMVQARKIEQVLEGQALSFSRREETARAVTGYRVYLPPFPSKEDAERKRRELTKLGFKDHALMHDEGLSNAVSLGLFGVEANALSRLKQLAQKGVQAKIQPFEQTRTVYWIELAPLTPALDLGARLGSVLAGIVGADVREIPCPAPLVPTPAPTPGAPETDVPPRG